MSLVRHINDLGEMQSSCDGERMLDDLLDILKRQEIDIGFRIDNGNPRAYISRYGEVFWSKIGYTFGAAELSDLSYMRWRWVKQHRDIVQELADFFKTYNIVFKCNSGGYIRVYTEDTPTILFECDSTFVSDMGVVTKMSFRKNKSINVYNKIRHHHRHQPLTLHPLRSGTWWKTQLRYLNFNDVIGFILSAILLISLFAVIIYLPITHIL